MIPRIACVLVLGVGCQVGIAGYTTGFEPNDYVPGSLNGQDGWNAVGFPGVNVVSAPTYPAVGTQSVQLTGSQIGVHPFAAPETASSIEWAWYLDSSTFVTGGPYFSFYAEQTGSPGGAMFNLIWNYDGLDLQYPAGGVLTRVDLGTTMPMDTWVTFAVTTDPNTYAAELMMNGTSLYTWQGLSTTVNSIGLLRSSAGGPGNVGYLDAIQLGISGIPEPTTLALVALMCVALRRR